MTQDELNLVLDALKWCHGGEPCGTAEAIAVVEKALAQRTWLGLSLEWVESPNHISYGKDMMEAIVPLGKDNSLHLYCPVEQIANVASALKALAQEQEPVADDFFKMIADKNPKPFPLPQRTWAGLTEDEIEILFQSAAGADEEVHIRFARAIETKLKELNT